MQGGNHMLLEEPVRLASVLTPSKPKVFPSLTKIVGTLGPNSQSVEVIEECLTAGMSVARFDFSWMDATYHQETLDNLRKAAHNLKKLCPIMLDTLGPEIQVHNSTGGSIQLKAGNHVTITPDLSKAPSPEILPIKFGDLAKVVKKGDTLFIGQYLFTGSETTSLWLEVLETSGENVNCLVKNTATLAGPIFTLHVSQVHISLPTLSEYDKQVISTWGLHNSVDIISLSHTRSAEDVKELRAFLQSHNLQDTQIYAKVENNEGLEHFDEILQEADGIIISRGDLGIDLPPERVFMSQKTSIQKCNLAGKPVIITRVVDSMIDNLRPTRAEATDVANAVLDGTDGILLGAETLRGLYPVDAVSTVGRICAEAETVYDQSLHFKKIVRHVGEPMSHEESVASSAVRSAMKVKAAAIVVFTFSGNAARLIAKYRPPMPVLVDVFPRDGSDPSKWRSYGTTQDSSTSAAIGSCTYDTIKRGLEAYKCNEKTENKRLVSPSVKIDESELPDSFQLKGGDCQEEEQLRRALIASKVDQKIETKSCPLYKRQLMKKGLGFYIGFNGTLYVLVTDEGFLISHPDAVWQTLNKVSEEETFVTSGFVRIMGQATTMKTALDENMQLYKCWNRKCSALFYTSISF